MNEQKKLTPELEKRVQQAVDNFMQGYGCCQSVVAAFADLYRCQRSGKVLHGRELDRQL